MKVVPSAGSVDSKLAMWAAEASKPSQSSGPSSESSPTSNPEYKFTMLDSLVLLCAHMCMCGCIGIEDKFVLHAVQGKPPSTATGRVGAVGQIHLICTMKT